MNERTVRCACGRLYKQYAMYAGDQSVCPKCRREAEEEMAQQEKSRMLKRMRGE